MKLYNVLWDDRHVGTTATPFKDLDEAKAWARAQAERCCTDSRDFKEGHVDGWLYFVEYSTEGDCLWITEHDI